MERVGPPIEILRTERLVLRAVERADVETITRNASDFDVVRDTLTMPHPYRIEDAHAFIDRVENGMQAGDSYVWAICDHAADHLGSIGLHCDWKHLHAELGYVLGKHHWRRGYATEAVRAVVRFAFERTPLERLHAGYFTRNPASGRVLEKCGFVPEGLRPRMYLRFGEWADQALVRLLKSEWTPNANTTT